MSSTDLSTPKERDVEAGIYLDVAFCVALAVLTAYALKCLFTCFYDTVRENVQVKEEAAESNNNVEIEVRDLENN